MYIVSLIGDQHLTKPQMSAITGRVRLCVSSVLSPPPAPTDILSNTTVIEATRRLHNGLIMNYYVTCNKHNY